MRRRAGPGAAAQARADAALTGAAPGTQAILRALEVVRQEDWFAGCRVWLYRGAWQASTPALWQATAAAARSSRTWLRARACLPQMRRGG